MKLKTKKVIAAIAIMTSAFLIGRFTSVSQDTVNMNKVVDIQANEYGAQITLLDGNAATTGRDNKEIFIL